MVTAHKRAPLAGARRPAHVGDIMEAVRQVERRALPEGPSGSELSRVASPETLQPRLSSTRPTPASSSP